MVAALHSQGWSLMPARQRLAAAAFAFACVCSRLGATDSVTEGVGSRLGCYAADRLSDTGGSTRSLDGPASGRIPLAAPHRFAIVAIACNGTDYLAHRGEYQLERSAQLARNLNRVIPQTQRSQMQITTVLLLSGYDGTTRVPGFDRHIVVERDELHFHAPKRSARDTASNEAPSWALPPEAQPHLRKRLPRRGDGVCT